MYRQVPGPTDTIFLSLLVRINAENDTTMGDYTMLYYNLMGGKQGIARGCVWREKYLDTLEDTSESPSHYVINLSALALTTEVHVADSFFKRVARVDATPGMAYNCKTARINLHPDHTVCSCMHATTFFFLIPVEFGDNRLFSDLPMCR